MVSIDFVELASSIRLKPHDTRLKSYRLRDVMNVEEFSSYLLMVSVLMSEALNGFLVSVKIT